MLVLGIETSCDETALALVNDEGIVCQAISSQVDIHALFGGVVPELASREHARLIGPLLDLLQERSGYGETLWQHVDRVAVSRGPGLLGSLLIGVGFAKTLAFAHTIPLIGINHLHAHLLVAGMESKLEYPALGILVSGGHTHLYHMQSASQLITLGRTLDDAAGEACDKFAKMAGLPYPGGALLDALGQRGQADPKLFPRPYTHNDTLNFSFSGLKTAGATWLQQHPEARFPANDTPAKERLDEAPQALCNAAASYLLAVAETLVIKARQATSNIQPRCLVLAGGVAANSVIRAKFQELGEELGIPLLVPRLALCTDNGIMVAWNGLLLARQGLCHDLSLSAIPRGKVIPEDWASPTQGRGIPA